MNPVLQSLDRALLAALAAVIGNHTGSSGRIAAATAISGGSISRALVVHSDDTRFFVKLNDVSLAEMFVAEADALAALAACRALRVPQVVGKLSWAKAPHGDPSSLQAMNSSASQVPA